MSEKPKPRMWTKGKASPEAPSEPNTGQVDLALIKKTLISIQKKKSNS